MSILTRVLLPTPVHLSTDASPNVRFVLHLSINTFQLSSVDNKSASPITITTALKGYHYFIL